jgi:hypothetical protein
MKVLPVDALTWCELTSLWCELTSLWCELTRAEAKPAENALELFAGPTSQPEQSNQ